MTLSNRMVSLLSVFAMLTFWYMCEMLGWTDPNRFPGPTVLASTFGTLWANGYGGFSIWGHIGMSLMRALSGFTAAVVLGVPLGLFIGRNRVAAAIAAPIIGFLRPIPPIAFITLFIFYFGIGEAPKIGLIFMACFWYVILNCADGVRAIPETLIRAGRNIGLSPRQLFFSVIIPAAMPSIMTAMRAASAISWTLVVASELIGAQAGLGYLILDSAQYFNIPMTYVGIILIGIIGLIWELLLSRLQRRVLHWQGQ